MNEQPPQAMPKQSVVGARMETALSTLISMGGSVERETHQTAGSELREAAGLTPAQWNIVFTVMKGLDVLEFKPSLEATTHTAIHLNPEGLRKAVYATRLPASLLEELELQESLQEVSENSFTASFE